MKNADLLAKVLEECLQRTRQGEPIDSVLADYANIADDLRPLLITAQMFEQPVHVPQAARARSQARFLAAARQTRSIETERARKQLAFDLHKPLLIGRWLPARLAVALVLVMAVFISGGYGVNQVAAQSLPGDRFYLVKLVVEQVQLQLAPNVASRIRLEMEFDQRRKVEVEHLIQDDRSEPVIFSGFAVQGSTGKWDINGIPVDLTPAQEIQLASSKNVELQVQGQVQPDGHVLVSDAEPHSINFMGKLEGIDTQAWQVGGVTFSVGEETLITGNPQIGSNVNVIAVEDDDAVLEAVSIEAQFQPLNGQQTSPIAPGNNNSEGNDSENNSNQQQNYDNNNQPHHNSENNNPPPQEGGGDD